MKLTQGKATLPISTCPICGYEMDDATCPAESKVSPSTGDLSVCLNCGELLMFNDILVAKKLETVVFLLLPVETQAEIQAISKAIRKRGPFKP